MFRNKLKERIIDLEKDVKHLQELAENHKHELWQVQNPPLKKGTKRYLKNKEVIISNAEFKSHIDCDNPYQWFKLYHPRWIYTAIAGSEIITCNDNSLTTKPKKIK